MTAGSAIRITPMLTVNDAARAIDFYHRAFGARELSRLTSPEGRIVALLAIEDAEFGVVDETPQAHNLSPQTLHGTSVRISLYVPDPDAVAQHAIAEGADLVFPVADQPYGLRQGRVRDPFGHHWLMSWPINAG